MKNTNEELLFRILVAATKHDEFYDPVQDQIIYLQAEHKRNPVGIFISYSLFGQIIASVLKDPVEVQKTLEDLTSAPQYLFTFNSLPVYYNPMLRNLQVMVIAEPRFWVKRD